MPSRARVSPIWLPSVSRGALLPAFEFAPGLAAVKQTALDSGCGPALAGGWRERRGERIAGLAGAGVASVVAGPGSDFSEVPVLGLKPAALEPVAAPTCPPGSVATVRAPGDHLVIHDVAEPSFEGAHRFHGCLAGGGFAVVAGAAFTVAVAELDDGHDVQHPVDLAVAGPGQAVADLVAGGGAGRRGAVPGGEVGLPGNLVTSATPASSRAAPEGPIPVRSVSVVAVVLSSSFRSLLAAFCAGRCVRGR